MGGQDFPVPSHGNFQHLILGMDSAVIGVTLARDKANSRFFVVEIFDFGSG